MYRTSNIHCNLGHADIGLVEIVNGLLSNAGAFEPNEADSPLGKYMGVSHLETGRKMSFQLVI